MAVRFIEYVQIDGREVSLYIMQEISKDDSICFEIQVHDVEDFNFYLCKKSGTSWNIVTQSRPMFILAKLYPVATDSIDGYLKLKKLYILPN